jgi:Cytochrome C oxidase, cbb3-type, subunit III
MRQVFHSRTARLWIALAITLASACADPQDLEDPSELIESGDPAQNSEGTEPIRGTGDGQAMPDAAVSREDAGAGSDSDAGSSTAKSDAGSASTDASSASPDAGSTRADAGSVVRDAGATTDAGAGLCSTLTYASFGMQFMSSYCTGCHSGEAAKHGVQLNTLAGVQKNKAAIKATAVTGATMPMGNSQLSAADRQKLGQWLDCGPN